MGGEEDLLERLNNPAAEHWLLTGGGGWGGGGGRGGHMQVDTAANGTVSRQRGGGDGRVREGPRKGSPFFSRSDSAGPRSASTSPGWWDNWKN